MHAHWLKKAILPSLVAAVGFGYIALEREHKLDAYIAEYTEQQILADFTDKVVFKALDQLTASIKTLHHQASQLQQQPQQTQLAEAANAWLQARHDWKQTMAYQFGPAAFYGLDKQLSAWPVDHILLEGLLAQAERGELEITAAYLRDPMDSTLRGFHAAEYLLYRDGKVRNLAEMSAHERTYLAAVTEAMLQDVVTWKALWEGKQALPEDELAILAKVDEVRFKRPFGDEFKYAGDPEKSRYFDRRSALQELFQDSVELAEGMCPAIGDAFSSGDPKDSETWYAQIAQKDFLAELASVENTYLGGQPGDRGYAAARLVEKRHPVLAKRIEIGLADLAYRLEVLQQAEQLSDAERKLAARVAYASCMKLEGRMEVAMTMIFPPLSPTTGWFTK